MNISYLEIYKDVRRESPEVNPAIHFRSVCTLIARHGTIEDLRALNNYLEAEEEGSFEQSQAM